MENWGRRAAAAAALAAAMNANADIASQLPLLAPRVVSWARSMQEHALRAGTAANPRQKALAAAMGVREPGRIRIVVVDRVPLPDEPLLKAAAQDVGLSQATASGMTLGYAVYLRKGSEGDARLLSHEFRHVAQYESAGGIAPFLARHLPDLVTHGYEDSPFEVDARAHERQSFPDAAG